MAAKQSHPLKSLADRYEKLMHERSEFEVETALRRAEFDREIAQLRNELLTRGVNGEATKPAMPRLVSPVIPDDSERVPQNGAGANDHAPTTQKGKILAVLEKSKKAMTPAEVAEALDREYGGYGDEDAAQRVFFSLQSIRAHDKELVVKPAGKRGLWMHADRAKEAGIAVE